MPISDENLYAIPLEITGICQEAWFGGYDDTKRLNPVAIYEAENIILTGYLIPAVIVMNLFALTETKRKLKETYWIHKIDNMHPKGMTSKLSFTIHNNCIVARCLINVVYLTVYDLIKAHAVR